MVGEFILYDLVPPAVPADHIGDLSPPLRLMHAHGRWLLAGALVMTWWYTHDRHFGVLRSALATFLVFYCTTVGFGVHYLVWAVPFALMARERWLWPYTVAATGALLAAYLMGPDDVALPPAIPWPAMRPDLREFLVKLATLPSWVICGMWALSLLRRCHRMRRMGHDTQAT